MFDLVADVERYPQFVPLCEALSVRSRREKADIEMLIADMSVGYKAIRETFTSKVLLNRAALEINAQYIDGPFRYLDNKWRFEPTGETSCKVIFYIDYEFKSRMLGMLMGYLRGWFDTVASRFVEAFLAIPVVLLGLLAGLVTTLVAFLSVMHVDLFRRGHGG